ncbi:hypothetical protein DMN91_008401 [Ooceraea biroi]|uniref:Ribonuclease P protein subunit p25 n=1 Tax=Ooceraea biroi TaxID=2015173 RepID=A0A026WUV0_OOCBI|nr:ribonuclease P protein subunit p25-like protein [Ooceraea biroi]XP_011329923.1 ribonuclease P protein subunit p25-like protein [Ooceraea biroi]XP_011329924.1 ribonuclease P protein subunit p25-like protein [Ooceraea biroi]EZA59792.1 Ribonuclease P protein subunit p25 [Ooceraea biroi]RLU19842.1 hypothetical protein DMN91_008401 [Ooceraea biroi]
MGRSKLKKRLKRKVEAESTEEPQHKVPIKNLPEKFVWMHVKSGTKMRNVFAFALKEFPSHNSIVWTGIGQGISKAISCAELFKRHHEGLHQVTKLCYTKLESKEDTADKNRVPHIHILLTKNIKDPTEPGYQAPGDGGEFPEKKEAAESKTCTALESAGSAPSIDVEEFTATKLRIGLKRFKQDGNPSKKIKHEN